MLRNIYSYVHRFRWVFCQLEVLRQCLPPSVRHTLAELPETLDETYERILSEIPKSNRVHAHRLLQCLTVAVRPLEVKELAEVLAVDFGTARGIPELKEDLRWEDQEQAVLSACSSLIAVVGDEDFRVVQFSHFSVKEFLTSNRLATSKTDASRYHHIHLGEAHTILAQACLSVLLRLDYDIDRRSITSFPLAGYAADHFGDHVEFEDVLSHICDGVDHLLDADKPHFAAWLWLRNSRYLYEHPRRPEAVPLYYVADFGYFDLANRLISKRPEGIDALGEDGTLLHAASHRGHCKVMDLLLEHLDVDIRNLNDQTPLHLAAEGGFLEAIQILIECNADIEARDNRGQTPLYSGIFNGLGDTRLDVAKFLLAHGAEADTRKNDDSTPLHAASFNGSVKTAQMLLEHGTDIDAQDKEGQTPLHRVVFYLIYLTDLMAGQFFDVIRLLLEHGADVDAQDNNHWTPLHLAAQSSSVKAARLLLEHGANIHARNKKGRTPLHEALWGCIEKTWGFDFGVIRFLLEHGADVDAQDNDQSTPLHMVAECGHVQAARVLLEHGAGVHLQNNEGMTPLQVASKGGHAEFAQWLSGYLQSDQKI